MNAKDISILIQRRQRYRLHAAAGFYSRLKKFCIVSGMLLCLFAAVFSFVFALIYTSFVSGLPSLEQIPVLLNPNNGQLLQPTRVYDRSGTHVYLSIENQGVSRRYLTLNPDQPEFISPRLVQMTIIMQDPDYWQHAGFDWRHLTSPQPGTLAERLVDRLLLYDVSPGVKRTIYMRLLAAQLVNRYSRTQVLEWFFNSAYYGHLAYGADSAAWLYFDKPASQLDIAEAALMVALSETPALNPIDSPAAAIERQREMLLRLLEVHAISDEEYEQAVQKEMNFRAAISDEKIPAEAFMKLVLEQLSQDIDIRRIEMGGLKIITTLDDDLQSQLTCAVKAQLQQLNNLQSDLSSECEAARLLPTLPPSALGVSDQIAASALILDPNNGQVLAMLGKSNLTEEKASISGSQPGSMLTPFIAMMGFSRGLSPSSLVWDIPASMPRDLKVDDNDVFHGPVRLRIALANDYLTPFTQLLFQFTPESVWQMAQPFGLGGINGMEASTSVLFDGADVTTLQLAWAYTPFATAGIQTGLYDNQSNSLQPVMVLSIDDVDGRLWLGGKASETRSLLSPQLAYLVHDILADTLARRESLGYPNALEIGRPSAAKVGQSAGGKQVWTIGYTPQRLVQTWFGASEPSQCRDCNLDVRVAAGLWHALIQYASRDLPADGWDMPVGISTRQVCDPSGLLPTLECPGVVSEIFLEGSEPQAYDSLFRHYQINSETGLLATVFTPLELIEDKTFMVVPPEALSWAKENNIALPPDAYDVIQTSQISRHAYISSPSLFEYIHGRVQVRGSAAGEGFEIYRLQVGKGLNPEAWQHIGADQHRMVQDGLLGTWDTSGLEDGLYALRLVVQRQGQEITNAITQVTVDNTAPNVQMIYPLFGQEFSLKSGREIILQVEVTDNVGIERLEWFIDGKMTAEQMESPYIYTWMASAGEHGLHVKAFDLAGNSSESETVEVLVKSN